jgi:hypothetical protein
MTVEFPAWTLRGMGELYTRRTQYLGCCQAVVERNQTHEDQRVSKKEICEFLIVPWLPRFC